MDSHLKQKEVTVHHSSKVAELPFHLKIETFLWNMCLAAIRECIQQVNQM